MINDDVILMNSFRFICPGSLIVGSLQDIFHKEGLRGMYRGLSPTVLALLPNWAVSFDSCLYPNSFFNACSLFLCLLGSLET